MSDDSHPTRARYPGPALWQFFYHQKSTRWTDQNTWCSMPIPLFHKPWNLHLPALKRRPLLLSEHQTIILIFTLQSKHQSTSLFIHRQPKPEQQHVITDYYRRLFLKRMKPDFLYPHNKSFFIRQPHTVRQQLCGRIT